jgi:TonB family protein
LSDRLNSIPYDEHAAGLLPVTTMVLWCVCLAVGVIGLRTSLRRSAPAVEPPPIDAELLNVEAMNRRPTVVETPPSTPASPADMSAPPPQPIIAPPTPAVAFAEEVKTPVHAVTTPEIAATQPSIIQLTFGEGEGRQPPPEYPDEARFASQEGTVVVRMTVDKDGRVSDARAFSPCPWPILNSAAVHAVRTTWRFPSGPVRSYEVSIQFQLNRHH